MDFLILLGILFLSSAIYIFLTGYRFQRFYRRRKTKKNFIDKFLPKVKGTYYATGYYASGHPFVHHRDHRSMNLDRRASFYKCYNIVTFKTKDANWELFFYLVKEKGVSFQEVMAIRTFPKERKIRSEGTVEKNAQRVNVLTNNRYLTGILESAESKELLRWILRKSGDAFYLSHNNLYYKIPQEGKHVMSVDRAMDIIKGIHNLKNRIYKKETIEY